MDLVPELKRLTAPHEQDDPTSYTPYIKDLGICKISPYSSTANPLMYTLIHITGTAMGHERSMRAMRVSEEAQEPLLRMGCMAAMCLRNYSGYEMIASSTKEEMEEFKAKRRDANAFATGPDIEKYDAAIAKGMKIPSHWKPWFRTGTGQDVLELLLNSEGLFDSFRRMIKARISYFDMRQGSIGKHVREYVTAPDLK